ncbi:transcriptional regulator [Staphylococcus pseudoxylosus]|uniref:RinA family phage transcriptional regulator n=1 Tax=Staphylococcus TaxID=1279 RepID=UPI00057BF12B|nr:MULTISPECIES: RinA family phage transcriptional regulator [Staphylococcus]MEB8088244.1 transcriptional regulator [Staphylococcus pseudoxylosus]PTI10706.1 transcriptional regulator [Staphylococcus xylosus]
MQTLERHDIKKLEGYIKNIKQYRKDLKFRGYEILENHDPENIGAGKSNMPGNPIEREVLKRFNDKKYNNLDNIVSSVEWLISNVDDESLELMKLKYWNTDQKNYPWEYVAEDCYMSKTTALRKRDAWLIKLADKMEYII